MLEMNWKEKIISNQQRIMKVCNCFSCGGNEVNDNFECIYCGNINSQLKEELTQISKVFKEFNGKELNDPFIIVSLKKLNNYLKFVSSLSKKEVDEAYLTWAKKILTGEVTDSDNDAILNLFSGADLCQDEVAVSIQNKILIDTVVGKRQYPHDVVTGALYHLFYQILKPWVKTCEIESKVLEENVNGEAYFDQVAISEDDIKDFIINGGSSIINTIGHEARHIYQNYKRSRNIVENKYDLLMLYDNVLNSKRKGTYDDNYYKQVAEIDARIYGYFIEEQFLKSFGLVIPDDLKKQNCADYTLLITEDTSRTVDGEKVDLEDEVLSILNSEPDLYNHYLQFGYEFVKEENQIRFKTSQELIDDYLWCEDITKENLYIELIGRSRKREQRLQKDSKTI